MSTRPRCGMFVKATYSFCKKVGILLKLRVQDLFGQSALALRLLLRSRRIYNGANSLIADSVKIHYGDDKGNTSRVHSIPLPHFYCSSLLIRIKYTLVVLDEA